MKPAQGIPGLRPGRAVGLRPELVPVSAIRLPSLMQENMPAADAACEGRRDFAPSSPASTDSGLPDLLRKSAIERGPAGGLLPILIRSFPVRRFALSGSIAKGALARHKGAETVSPAFRGFALSGRVSPLRLGSLAPCHPGLADGQRCSAALR